MTSGSSSSCVVFVAPVGLAVDMMGEAWKRRGGRGENSAWSPYLGWWACMFGLYLWQLFQHSITEWADHDVGADPRNKKSNCIRVAQWASHRSSALVMDVTDIHSKAQAAYLFFGSYRPSQFLPPQQTIPDSCCTSHVRNGLLCPDCIIPPAYFLACRVLPQQSQCDWACRENGGGSRRNQEVPL